MHWTIPSQVKRVLGEELELESCSSAPKRMRKNDTRPYLDRNEMHEGEEREKSTSKTGTIGRVKMLETEMHSDGNEESSRGVERVLAKSDENPGREHVESEMHAVENMGDMTAGMHRDEQPNLEEMNVAKLLDKSEEHPGVE